MFCIPKYHLAKLGAEAYHIFIAKLDMHLKQVSALEITWQMKLRVDIELHRCIQPDSGSVHSPLPQFLNWQNMSLVCIVLVMTVGGIFAQISKV